MCAPQTPYSISVWLLDLGKRCSGTITDSISNPIAYSFADDSENRATGDYSYTCANKYIDLVPDVWKKQCLAVWSQDSNRIEDAAWFGQNPNCSRESLQNYSMSFIRAVHNHNARYTVLLSRIGQSESIVFLSLIDDTVVSCDQMHIHRHITLAPQGYTVRKH